MTSKAFITNEFEYLVNGEAGADYAWSCENLSDGAGRVSAQIDLTAAPRPFQFELHISLQMISTAATQGKTFAVYKAVTPDGDATQISGDVGATDAALGDTDQLRNLDYIGSVTAEEDSSTTVMNGVIKFECRSRYLTLVAENNTGAALNATDSNFVAVLIGRSVQGQAT